jgi:hypothetical protein
MLKAAVVQGLKDSGYFTKVEIEQHWLYTFKPIAREERAQVLNDLINPTRKEEANGLDTQESEMTETTVPTTINATVDLGYGMKAQIVATLNENDKWGRCDEDSLFVVTCADCQDGVLNVGTESGKTAQHAINAATDWFYYREFLTENVAHVEPGLRLNVTKEEMDALILASRNGGFAYQEGNLGMVGRRYKGDYFLKVKQGSWGSINFNFGKFKVTKINQSQDEILKQDFVDALLSGYTLNISLAHVKMSWLAVVVANLTNPDKAEGFANYWTAKGAASLNARARNAGRKARGRVARSRKANDGDLGETSQKIVEKMTQIYTVTGGGQPVLTDITSLPNGKYDVLTTRMNKKAEFTFTGTPGSVKMAEDYALMGYTLKA